MTRPRILALLPDSPWPLDTGKRIRQWANVRALARAGDVFVRVLLPGNTGGSAPPDVALADFQIVTGRPPSQARALARALRGRPWEIGVHDWPTARKHLMREGGRYDLVWYGSMAQHSELAAAIDCPRSIVDLDDVETLKARLALHLPRDEMPTLRRLRLLAELPRWARVERTASQTADVVVVCTDEDRQALGVSNARVVPNSYPDPGRMAHLTTDQTMLLVGNFDYPPNLDAAAFMAGDVLPRILPRVPAARLLLVGRGGGRALTELDGLPGVEVRGPVRSIEDVMAETAVVVVPVRYGGGTRIKVLEAFAYGVPTVATRLGVAGYPVTNGEHLLIRDEAADFAGACVDLLEDPTAGAPLVEAGRLLYEQSYTPDAVVSRVETLVSEVLGRSGS